MPRREREALVCALAAVLLWSTVATGFKLGLRSLAVTQLLFVGTLLSWALFAVLAFARGRWRLAPGEAGLAAVLGLVNPFLYYLVLFEAYDRLPAQIAQPLNYTWAIVLALLAVPVLGQRLTARTLAGIVLSYAGVVVLVSHNPLDPGAALDPLGIALALASTVLWAGYWLANTRARSEPLALMFWSFTAGLSCIALACAAGPGWPAFTLPTLAYGAWVGFVEMGVTFLLWQRALRLTNHAARIGQLVFLSPFLSFALIATVLGEPVGLRSIAGLAAIVAGLLVTGTPRTQQ